MLAEIGEILPQNDVPDPRLVPVVNDEGTVAFLSTRLGPFCSSPLVPVVQVLGDLRLVLILVVNLAGDDDLSWEPRVTRTCKKSRARWSDYKKKRSGRHV